MSSGARILCQCPWPEKECGLISQVVTSSSCSPREPRGPAGWRAGAADVQDGGHEARAGQQLHRARHGLRALPPRLRLARLWQPHLPRPPCPVSLSHACNTGLPLACDMPGPAGSAAGTRVQCLAACAQRGVATPHTHLAVQGLQCRPATTTVPNTVTQAAHRVNPTRPCGMPSAGIAAQAPRAPHPRHRRPQRRPQRPARARTGVPASAPRSARPWPRSAPSAWRGRAGWPRPARAAAAPTRSTGAPGPGRGAAAGAALFGRRPRKRGPPAPGRGGRARAASAAPGVRRRAWRALCFGASTLAWRVHPRHSMRLCMVIRSWPWTFSSHWRGPALTVCPFRFALAFAICVQVHTWCLRGPTRQGAGGGRPSSGARCAGARAAAAAAAAATAAGAAANRARAAAPEQP